MNFQTHFVVSFVICSIIFCFSEWRAHESNHILMSHYGYNYDGMTHEEIRRNMAPENIDRGISLENSVMGVGWMAKALLSLPLLIPYIIAVYVVDKLWRMNLPNIRKIFRIKASY